MSAVSELPGQFFFAVLCDQLNEIILMLMGLDGDKLQFPEKDFLLLNIVDLVRSTHSFKLAVLDADVSENIDAVRLTAP